MVDQQVSAVPEDDYDPFEAFDDVIGGDIRDPYPDFADKRRNRLAALRHVGATTRYSVSLSR